MIEEWKKVVGYEGLYEISNFGRVLSKGSVRNERLYWPKILSCSMQNGYLAVGLKGRRHYVHRLVAEAFLGPCPEGCEVNHRDGVKTNNVPENLEWITRSQNSHHAIAHGLRKRVTAGCFKKGGKPWNAGKKTGQRPWNYRQDRRCSTPGCTGKFFCRDKCERCHRRARYLAEHGLLP